MLRLYRNTIYDMLKLYRNAMSDVIVVQEYNV